MNDPHSKTLASEEAMVKREEEELQGREAAVEKREEQVDEREKTLASLAASLATMQSEKSQKQSEQTTKHTKVPARRLRGDQPAEVHEQKEPAVIHETKAPIAVVHEVKGPNAARHPPAPRRAEALIQTSSESAAPATIVMTPHRTKTVTMTGHHEEKKISDDKKDGPHAVKVVDKTEHAKPEMIQTPKPAMIQVSQEAAKADYAEMQELRPEQSYAASDDEDVAPEPTNVEDEDTRSSAETSEDASITDVADEAGANADNDDIDFRPVKKQS